MPQRNEIDPIFKEVMVALSQKVDIALETQIEVSRLPRTIYTGLPKTKD